MGYHRGPCPRRSRDPGVTVHARWLSNSDQVAKFDHSLDQPQTFEQREHIRHGDRRFRQTGLLAPHRTRASALRTADSFRNGDFVKAIQRGAQRAVSAALQRLLGRLRRSRGAAWPVTGPILIDGWTRGRKARSVGQFTTQDLVLTDICIDSYGIPESRMPSTC